MNLVDIDMDSFFKEKFSLYLSECNRNIKNVFKPARVLAVFRNYCKLITDQGEINGIISRKIIEKYSSKKAYPSVGDWVVITYNEEDGKAIIIDVLTRKNKLSRNFFERKRKNISVNEQVFAANIDIVFLVLALNMDFNLRRLERYLVALWDINISPVILLNKSDLCEDYLEKYNIVAEATIGIPVFVLSAVNNQGIDNVEKFIVKGQTGIFLGSSGVGKSTIINKILGEEVIKVLELSKYKDRGKHTTSYRSMYKTKNGGMIIDTPGLRAINLWSEVSTFDEVFSDIVELTKNCYFSNCKHRSESGCAIKKAIDEGSLSEKRLKNYRKMLLELELVKRRVKQKEDKKPRVSYKRKFKMDSKRKKYFYRYSGVTEE